ncbi:hypothetical protein [Clostridium sp.]|uniref:hypothetical protein n=1 Tax=Clostridium sp. TaxID=1506 RepID=UPI00290D668F|nr:hypothetical protein [Clostridium sp.]MDU7364101.1 hypothetical protein [Clostridium sp.]
MQSELDKKIELRLSECNLSNFSDLPEKTQKRLIQIEEYVINNESIMGRLLDEIRKLRITKSAIASSDVINISRKTIYNDDILNIYIDNIIKNQEDIFNLKKISKLETEIKDLNELNNSLVNNVINFNLLKLKLKEYEEENKSLLQGINEISNSEQNRVVRNLEIENIKKGKVIDFWHK